MISASQIVARENSADAKTNNALSFRHRASSTLQLVVASTANKFSKGSTNDKTLNNNTGVVDDEDKIVAVEDVVTVKHKTISMIPKHPFTSTKIAEYFVKENGNK